MIICEQISRINFYRLEDARAIKVRPYIATTRCYTGCLCKSSMAYVRLKKIVTCLNETIHDCTKFSVLDVYIYIYAFYISLPFLAIL